jgi:hypothetical protein
MSRVENLARLDDNKLAQLGDGNERAEKHGSTPG